MSLQSGNKMDYKPCDDGQKLIGEKAVYGLTTSEIMIPEKEFVPGILKPRSFESRGILIVLVSVIVVAFLLISVFFIQAQYQPQYPKTKIIQLPSREESRESSWTKKYILPKDVQLLEVSSDALKFNSNCPAPGTAVIINLETDVADIKPWLKECGGNIYFFRGNGNFKEKDVGSITKYLPNAQYISVKVFYHGVKGSTKLKDAEFIQELDELSYLITSLEVSGHVTSDDLQALLDLLPFVEEFTLYGSKLCASLYRKPRTSGQTCKVYWEYLKKLVITLGPECQRTFEFIDMCWDMQNLKAIEVSDTRLNDLNVRYVEDVIDRYRITNATFRNNVCSDAIKDTNEYMCKSCSLTQGTERRT